MSGHPGRFNQDEQAAADTLEPFKLTLAQEWGYANTYPRDEARAAIYETRLHNYNHHRADTRIDVQTPLDRLHNLSGNYTYPAACAGPTLWLNKHRMSP